MILRRHQTPGSTTEVLSLLQHHLLYRFPERHHQVLYTEKLVGSVLSPTDFVSEFGLRPDRRFWVCHCVNFEFNLEEQLTAKPPVWVWCLCRLNTAVRGVFLGLQQPVVLNNTDQCNSLHQPDLLHGGRKIYLYFVFYHHRNSVLRCQKMLTLN